MSWLLRFAYYALLLGVALDLFWTACVASFAAHELIIGIPATVLSVAFCLFTVHKLDLRFRPSPVELAEIWRLPWYVTLDVAQVVWVLVQDLAGKRAPSLFRSAPWRENEESGRGTARRVLATAYTTVSPNFIVVGIDREQGQMLFHQLRATKVPVLAERLGAGDGR
jgi:multisubunit Na+/H+ antiporter MnhE subunit